MKPIFTICLLSLSLLGQAKVCPELAGEYRLMGYSPMGDVSIRISQKDHLLDIHKKYQIETMLNNESSSKLVIENIGDVKGSFETVDGENEATMIYANCEDYILNTCSNFDSSGSSSNCIAKGIPHKTTALLYRKSTITTDKAYQALSGGAGGWCEQKKFILDKDSQTLIIEEASNNSNTTRLYKKIQ